MPESTLEQRVKNLIAQKRTQLQSLQSMTMGFNDDNEVSRIQQAESDLETQIEELENLIK